MNIGTIREQKNNENRVGLTPACVKQLVEHHHEVFVEQGAGLGTGYSDEEYTRVGAHIQPDAIAVAHEVELLVKIKEPIEQEYAVLEALKGKALFTYLHLAGVDKALSQKLMECQITSIAYETVEDHQGLLPLLAPMSKVAGVLAIQYGCQYLQKKYHGCGVTLGHIKGAEQSTVVIIGGGVVGKKSAVTAAGMGSKVIVFEANEERVEAVYEACKKLLCGLFLNNIEVVVGSSDLLTETLKKADLLIGGVLVKGARAPKIVTEDMVAGMKKGAVIIDVAIDQGGCIYGSRPTTHDDPYYEVDGKLYCCISNMPGQVPLQSTQALTSATMPYLLKMADKGVLAACREDPGLAKGVNTHQGKLCYQAVAEAHNLPFQPFV